MIDELKTEFNDVNPSLCLRVMENCPTEEVAMLIFNTIEITVVTEFISKYVYWYIHKSHIVADLKNPKLAFDGNGRRNAHADYRENDERCGRGRDNNFLL